MEKARVAVIGGGKFDLDSYHNHPNIDVLKGPSGLSMLKTLREDGFDVTLFERRREVGGSLGVYG
jgi:ribulose 1,5-bisphosphate synthetase/thiazole synthase